MSVAVPVPWAAVLLVTILLSFLLTVISELSESVVYIHLIIYVCVYVTRMRVDFPQSLHSTIFLTISTMHTYIATGVSNFQ